MKCDQCSCPMRLSSKVCSSSSCSFQYVCDLCGSQRLTSEPLASGSQTAALWPDTSGYKSNATSVDNPRERFVLEGVGEQPNGRIAALSRTETDQLDTGRDTNHRVFDSGLLLEIELDHAKDFNYEPGSFQEPVAGAASGRTGTPFDDFD